MKVNRGCKGCARFVCIINADTVERGFCIERTGVMYIVDKQYKDKNNCDEYCTSFVIEGQEWK